MDQSYYLEHASVIQSDKNSEDKSYVNLLIKVQNENERIIDFENRCPKWPWNKRKVFLEVGEVRSTGSYHGSIVGQLTGGQQEVEGYLLEFRFNLDKGERTHIHIKHSKPEIHHGGEGTIHWPKT